MPQKLNSSVCDHWSERIFSLRYFTVQKVIVVEKVELGEKGRQLKK